LTETLIMPSPAAQTLSVLKHSAAACWFTLTTARPPLRFKKGMQL
jgi:hypothetical protein